MLCKGYRPNHIKKLLKKLYPRRHRVAYKYLTLKEPLRHLAMNHTPINEISAVIQEFYDHMFEKVELLKETKPKLVLKGTKLLRRIIKSANKLQEKNQDWMRKQLDHEEILNLFELEVPGIKTFVLSKMDGDIDVPIYIKGDRRLASLYQEKVLPSVLKASSDAQQETEESTDLSIANHNTEEIVRHPLIGSEILKLKMEGFTADIIANKLSLTTNDVNRFWAHYQDLPLESKRLYSKRNVFNWSHRLEEYFNGLWEQANSLPEYTEDGDVDAEAQDLCVDILSEILNVIDDYQGMLASLSNSSRDDIFSHYVDEYIQANVPKHKIVHLLNKINYAQRESLI